MQIANRIGCDEASVRRALRRTGFQRHLLPLDLETRYHFDIDTPIVLKDVDAMVTADWHIPLYDPGYVNEMIETAREKGIKTLIIAGDFWNYDALSAYFPKQRDAGLDREYKEGIAVMRALVETFDRIIYVWGNHDDRMAKALGHAMQFRDAMKMVFGALGSEILDKIEFTNLDHVWLVYGEPTRELRDGELEYEAHDPKQRWYICHPQSYSRNPLTAGRQLASKMGGNVVTMHSHHCAIGHAPDGDLVVAEGGGLFDPRKTAYLQRSTTFPRWQQGYAWLQGGRFHLTARAWESA